VGFDVRVNVGVEVEVDVRANVGHVDGGDDVKDVGVSENDWKLIGGGRV
jgi:hypothetical protein